MGSIGLLSSLIRQPKLAQESGFPSPRTRGPHFSSALEPKDRRRNKGTTLGGSVRSNEELKMHPANETRGREPTSVRFISSGDGACS